MGQSDRPFIFKTHGCGQQDGGHRHTRYCTGYSDCMKGSQTRRRMTSKARRRAEKRITQPSAWE